MTCVAREVEFVFELVKELTELPGPTGHEDAVQDWIERRWSGFGQDVRRTRVNNILARIGGTGPASCWLPTPTRSVSW
jgi:putative aminopeptidase FrvX